MNTLFNFIKAVKLVYAELRRKQVSTQLEKVIRGSIYQFYNLNAVWNKQIEKFECTDHDSDATTLYSITDIKSEYNKKDKLIITITSHRPGMIIGRAGKRIDDLKLWLKSDLEIGDNFELRLEECKIWYDMYN